MHIRNTEILNHAKFTSPKINLNGEKKLTQVEKKSQK